MIAGLVIIVIISNNTQQSVTSKPRPSLHQSIRFRRDIFNRRILFYLWMYVSSCFFRIVSFIILTICSSCGTLSSVFLTFVLSLKVCFESSFDFSRSLGALLICISHRSRFRVFNYLKSMFVGLKYAFSLGQFLAGHK